MLIALKALTVFVAGAIASLLVALLYGFVGHYLDLFILFPFIVAAAIVGVGTSLARRLHFNQGALLLGIGLILGAIAYPVYLTGKYAMLVSEFTQQPQPTQLTDFSFSTERLRSLTSVTRDDVLKARVVTDEALRQHVGQPGVLGQVLLNMEAGIPWQTRRLGEGNLFVGAGIELFKLAVMMIVSGTALRDTVRREAFLGLDGRDGRPRAVGNRRD